MSPAVKNPYAPMFLLCCAAAALAGMIAIAPGLPAAQDRDEETQDKLSTIQRSLVLDGSRIHFAGELQMNVTNFGFFGSLPKSSYVMSDAPSAQWPAGSGVASGRTPAASSGSSLAITSCRSRWPVRVASR